MQSSNADLARLLVEQVLEHIFDPEIAHSLFEEFRNTKDPQEKIELIESIKDCSG